MDKTSGILLTGANGLVGSYILRELIHQGYENIHIVKRENSKLDLIADLLVKVKIEETDINDIIAMANAIQSVEIVIHTAAIVSFDPKDAKKMMKTNVEGTKTVVDLCLEHQIKKFIYISSIAALGRSKSKKEIDERSKWINDKLNSQYSISKNMAEQEVWRGHAEGLNVSVINPSLILGGAYWNNGSSSIFQNIYNGIPMYPPGRTAVVDVRDVATFCIKLLESDFNGERFICSAENITYKDLFSKIAKSLGVTPPKRPLSPFFASISWRVILIKSRILGQRATITRQSMKNAFQNFKYLNDKSRKELGFEYRNVDQSIEDCCKVFIESKKAGKSFGILL